MGTKHDDSCLTKAKDDEPIFVLRASDVLAPSAVRDWAACAESLGVSAAKVREARALADRMVVWQEINGAKIPD